MDSLTGWHVSVWKLSLPQDLEEETQLSDKGEQVGVPGTARPSPSPEAPGLESSGLPEPWPILSTQSCVTYSVSVVTPLQGQRSPRQGVAVVKD